MPSMTCDTCRLSETSTILSAFGCYLPGRSSDGSGFDSTTILWLKYLQSSYPSLSQDGYPVSNANAYPVTLLLYRFLGIGFTCSFPQASLRLGCVLLRRVQWV